MSTFNELIDFTRSTTGTYLDSVVYGDELVTNGTFDSDLTGWTDVSTGTGSVAVVSGQVQLTRVDLNNRGFISQNIAVVAGATYKVQITEVSGQAYVAVGTTETGTTFLGQPLAAGENTFYITPNVTSVYINVRGIVDGVQLIDNISVKELIGGQVSGTPLLRTAAINEPRLEYDASGNPLGLLIEEGRTNVLLHSEEMTNAVWVSEFGNYGSIASSSLASPAGTGSFKLIAATNNGRQGRLQNASYNGNLTFSIFAKAGEYSVLQISDSIIASNYANFDLANGVIGNFGGYTVTMEDVGNGWYRCCCYFLYNANIVISKLRFSIVQSPTSPRVENFSGNGSDGIYLWGAQLETGAFPTSYIPTSGSTVTRAADVASLPVERFAYNQSKGSVVVEASSFANLSGSDNGYVAVLSDGTSNNRIQVLLRDSSQGFITGGLGGLDAGSVAQSQTTKLAMTVKTNDAGLSLNGGAVVTATSGNIPSPITDLRLGGRTSLNSATLCGHIKHIQYYPKRLSNTELQLLTQPSASPTMNLTFDGQATSTLVEGFHD